MTSRSRRPLYTLSVGLLNLTGLGFGYLVLKRWLVWGLHILGTILLIAGGIFFQAARSPYLWIAIFSIWLLWMALDGMRRARKLGPESSLLPQKTPGWALVVIPAGFLIVMGGALQTYQILGDLTYQTGIEAYQDQNFETAGKAFRRFSTTYQLTLNQAALKAERYAEEAELLQSADQAQQQGLYEEAIGMYKRYLSQSSGLLTSYVNQSLGASYQAWAEAQAEEDKYQQAIDTYRILKEQYPNTTAAENVDSSLAETYLDWAGVFWESGDHETAVEKAQIAHNTYPETPSGQEAVHQLGSIYMDWCSTLQEEGQYQKAVDLSQTLHQEYPASHAVQDNPHHTARIYYQWGSSLQAQGDYKSCLEKYTILQDRYPQAPISDQIQENVINAYQEWAQTLRDKDQYSAALEKYQTIQDQFPNTQAAQDAKDQAVETMLEKGYHTLDQKQYQTAMDTFQEAKEATEQEPLIQKAEQGYQETLVSLSQDSGEVGQDIISDARRTACKGEPAQSPAVGLNEDDPPRAVSCTSLLRLPDDLEPTTPGEFHYVVDVAEGQTLKQKCRYQAGHMLYRYQIHWTVTVRNAVSGEIYSSKTFYGSMPGKCQHVETFYGSTKNKYGSEPSEDEMINWVQAVLR